jgi:hypothetical protein
MGGGYQIGLSASASSGAEAGSGDFKVSGGGVLTALAFVGVALCAAVALIVFFKR